jgi:lysophospholipase L1-like esterase
LDFLFFIRIFLDLNTLAMKLKKLIYISILSIFGVACNNHNMESETFTYLALGDSYTIGERVAIPERYPVQLADTLKKSGFDISELKIIAKTGWTTDELAEAIDTAKTLNQYDLVTLLIGVNNQYRGRDLENYRAEFNQLLNRAIDFAGKDKHKVIVISIPDWSVTPFAADRDTAKIAKEIDQFNAVNFEETNKAGVTYVDVTAISRKAKNDTSLLANDGLHPSGKMYSLWVQEIFSEASSILTKK